MERTELRDQFFAEIKRDPWTHATVRLAADCWASGYEQALRDVAEHLRARERPADPQIGDAAEEVDSLRLRGSHRDRYDRAIEDMTAKRAEAEKLVGYAALGAKLHAPTACLECGTARPGPHRGTCSQSMMRGGPGVGGFPTSNVGDPW